MAISSFFCDNLVSEQEGFRREAMPKKKTPRFSPEIKEMSEEEAHAEVADFFLKLEKEYEDVSKEEMKVGAQKIQSYLRGEIGWGELFNFTPEMLFQMAEYGFMQFQAGRLEDAERVFKVLTVLDWNNHYYHSMMGSILQRQKRYGEAIMEYTQALELAPDDMVSLTHRGEIYLQHDLLEEARADLEKAIASDPHKIDRWANRARVLLEQLEVKGKQ
ncbi:MAG: hypothetical protein A3I05_03450 [Deltaproteobacteria bacterium RIFCSPLOWO2_02_FULL_44_10]|nr:MAG: hypothetical protein A3C46_03025 [Deltaproteobacteria bacterium RIFCSPHIGHO2_02_FULL_44_16]OGQ46229.1 MAG: hypothetical protein A3I05_03450 [Deltaproteobacteria bacterium RIFCSPLOWO2_02_FULL_44_10]